MEQSDAPGMTDAATITVKYRFVDGYHIFTSEDVRGLYVASIDPRRAFDDVAPVLREIVTLKTKRDCEVEATMTYDEFVAYAQSSHVPPTPVLSNRSFLIRCPA